MNRTDRLLAIILELQARKAQRADDLAATFEVSKRTIYRDIQALSEAGVPIIATPGRGFSLIEGYFLPPLSFTVDEATILLLGAQVMSQNFDSEYQAATISSARKIAGVLPEAQREKVEWVRSAFYFVSNLGISDDEAGLLQQLRRAIMKTQTVRFTYHARDSEEGENQSTEREADPYTLVYVAGTWMLIGYCHRRQANRSFRLSRMEKLIILPRTFTRPADQSHIQERRRIPSVSQTVRVLFSPSVARWVAEERFFFIAGQEMTLDGLIVTLKVRQLRDALHWILGWGSAAYVLEPDSLRDMVMQEARQILEQAHPQPAHASKA